LFTCKQYLIAIVVIKNQIAKVFENYEVFGIVETYSLILFVYPSPRGSEENQFGFLI